MSIKSVKFYFNRAEAGQPPVLTKAIQGHQPVKAPHAVEAMARIFDTIKREDNNAGQKVADFKKFTATLSYPSKSSNFALKIARNDKRVAIHIKSLKQDTAALLTNELSPLLPSSIKNSKGKISTFKRKNARAPNKDESTPLLNPIPASAPQRSCIDIISWLVSGLISLISKICNRSTLNETSAHTLPVELVSEEEAISERFNLQKVIEALEDEISKWEEQIHEMTQSRWPFHLDPVYHTLKQQIAENTVKIARFQSKLQVILPE